MHHNACIFFKEILVIIVAFSFFFKLRKIILAFSPVRDDPTDACSGRKRFFVVVKIIPSCINKVSFQEEKDENHSKSLPLQNK